MLLWYTGLVAEIQFFYSVGTSDRVGAFLVSGLERPYLLREERILSENRDLAREKHLVCFDS